MGVDRFARKIFGNPVVKSIGGWFQQDKLIEHYDTPVLSIRGGFVGNFHYLYTNPPHYRRFIILKIRNEGNKAATGCWADITINNSHLREIPLHWADSRYEVKRNSMDTITIPPEVTRDLDVAFSVYGEYQPGEVGIVIDTDTLPTLANQQTTRGTLDPSLVTPGHGFVNIMPKRSDQNQKSDPMKFGAWIASHEVLSDPRDNSNLHLKGDEPPKRYNSTIRVTCNEGYSKKIDMVLLITPHPSGLNFDWRLTPKAGE